MDVLILAIKRRKIVVINKNQGHGRLDDSDEVSGERMEVPQCRFNIPLLPLDKTVFLEGRIKERLPENEDLREDEMKEHLKRKIDL